MSEQVQSAPDISPGLSLQEQAALRLLRACQGYGIRFGRRGLSPPKRRYWMHLHQTRILIFIAADLDLSEACGLRVKDLNLRRGQILISQYYRRKGAEVKRWRFPMRPMGREACLALARELSELRLRDDDYVLSGSEEPIRAYPAQRSFKVIAAAAGFSPDGVCPSIFRTLSPGSRSRICAALLADGSNWRYRQPPRKLRGEKGHELFPL